MSHERCIARERARSGHDSQVAIEFRAVDDHYAVTVSPPHAPTWRSPIPLTATHVLEELAAQGCHSTDITDALFTADPNWALRHDAEVLRARRERSE